MLFIKRHKILTILFVTCIFLIIKNSSIPYFFTPSSFMIFIFGKPQGTLYSSIAEIIDIFTSAYVTSLLFFYMVDFLPAIRQEKKANDIIAPKLVNLYLYISEFLSRIEYSAKQESLLTGNPDDMDKLNIQNKTILCKQKIFINEQENSAIIFLYNILEDSNKYKTLILNTCNEISCSPNFSYCDAQIIHIISEIQLSTLWQILPKQNDSFLKIDFSERSYIGLGKGYQQLVLCHKKLAKFVEKRFSYEIIDTTYEEREKWEKGNVEFLNNIRTTV